MYKNSSYIIAGGRDYQFTNEDYWFLDTLGIKEVVSGCAKGADSCGEAWAKARGIPIKRFPAHWHEFGKSAGNIRNRQMAVYADNLVLFPGKTGSANMLEVAKSLNLNTFADRYLADVAQQIAHAEAQWAYVDCGYRNNDDGTFETNSDVYTSKTVIGEGGQEFPQNILKLSFT
tara:strand:- start:95 stop:616 length:522 start_codon:yes stop_codon:yes gene_type:complete